MTRPGFEPMSPGPLAKTRPMSWLWYYLIQSTVSIILISLSIFIYIIIYIHIYLYLYSYISLFIFIYIIITLLIHFHLSIYLSQFVHIQLCQVGLDSRIHRLHLCRGVRSPNECPGCDTKQSDGDVPMMLGFWGCDAPLHCHCSQVHSSPEW